MKCTSLDCYWCNAMYMQVQYVELLLAHIQFTEVTGSWFLVVSAALFM